MDSHLLRVRIGETKKERRTKKPYAFRHMIQVLARDVCIAFEESEVIKFRTERVLITFEISFRE